MVGFLEALQHSEECYKALILGCNPVGSVGPEWATALYQKYRKKVEGIDFTLKKGSILKLYKQYREEAYHKAKEKVLEDFRENGHHCVSNRGYIEMNSNLSSCPFDTYCNVLTAFSATRNLPVVEEDFDTLFQEQFDTITKDVASDLLSQGSNETFLRERVKDCLAFITSRVPLLPPKDVFQKTSATLNYSQLRGGRRAETEELVLVSLKRKPSQQTIRVLKDLNIQADFTGETFQELFFLRKQSDRYFQNTDYLQLSFACSVEEAFRLGLIDLHEGRLRWRDQVDPFTFRGAVVTESAGKYRLISIGNYVILNILTYLSSGFRHLLTQVPILSEGYHNPESVEALFRRINGKGVIADDFSYQSSIKEPLRATISDFRRATEFLSRSAIRILSEEFDNHALSNQGHGYFHYFAFALDFFTKDYEVVYQNGSKSYRVIGKSGALMGMPFTKEILHFSVFLGLFDRKAPNPGNSSILVLGDDVLFIVAAWFFLVAELMGLQINHDKVSASPFIRLMDRVSILVRSNDEFKIITSEFVPPKLFALQSKSVFGRKVEINIDTRLAEIQRRIQSSTGNLKYFDLYLMTRKIFEGSPTGLNHIVSSALFGVPVNVGGLHLATPSETRKFLLSRLCMTLYGLSMIMPRITLVEVTDSDKWSDVPKGYLDVKSVLNLNSIQKLFAGKFTAPFNESTSKFFMWILSRLSKMVKTETQVFAFLPSEIYKAVYSNPVFKNRKIILMSRKDRLKFFDRDQYTYYKRLQEDSFFGSGKIALTEGKNVLSLL